MTELILASILIPYASGLLTLVLPRNWIKTFSILVALLAGAAGIWVLVLFTLGGKTSETVNLLYIGNWLIYGIVIDKLSVLIGAASSSSSAGRTIAGSRAIASSLRPCR